MRKARAGKGLGAYQKTSGKTRKKNALFRKKEKKVTRLRGQTGQRRSPSQRIPLNPKSSLTEEGNSGDLKKFRNGVHSRGQRKGDT